MECLKKEEEYDTETHNFSKKDFTDFMVNIAHKIIKYNSKLNLDQQNGTKKLKTLIKTYEKIERDFGNMFEKVLKIYEEEEIEEVKKDYENIKINMRNMIQ